MRHKSISIALCFTATLTMAMPAHAATADVVEYYHAGFNHYFMTTFPDEAAALDAGAIKGWARTGQTFKVDVSGTAAVCRFFSTSFAPLSSHFYTANAGECSVVKSNPNWKFEANAFAGTVPNASGACPAGMSKVYRLYNNGASGAPNHRYTTSATIRATMISQGWTPEGAGEGVALCASAGTPQGPTVYELAYRVIGGVWNMSYTFGAAYVDKLRFTKIYVNTGSSSSTLPYLLEGTGPFNRPLAGGYSSSGDLFVAVWQYSSGSYNSYVFELTSSNTATGCYDYDANIDNLGTSCAGMYGMRTSSAVEEAPSARSEQDENKLKSYFR